MTRTPSRIGIRRIATTTAIATNAHIMGFIDTSFPKPLQCKPRASRKARFCSGREPGCGAFHHICWFLSYTDPMIHSILILDSGGTLEPLREAFSLEVRPEDEVRR